MCLNQLSISDDKHNLYFDQVRKLAFKLFSKQQQQHKFSRKRIEVATGQMIKRAHTSLTLELMALADHTIVCEKRKNSMPTKARIKSAHQLNRERKVFSETDLFEQVVFQRISLTVFFGVWRSTLK